MTLTLKDNDAGPEGTTITAANLNASGVANNGVATMPGSVFAASAAQEGSPFGVILALSGTQATIVNNVPANTTLNQISTGYYFTGPYGGTLSSNCWTFGIRHTSGFISSLRWSTANAMTFHNGDGNAASLGTLATGLTRSSSQWYYASIVQNNASGASAYSVKLYDVTAGNTLLGTVSGTTAFASTAAVVQLRYGSMGGTLGSGNSMGVDQLRYNDGSTVEIPPLSTTIRNLLAWSGSTWKRAITNPKVYNGTIWA